VPMKRFLAGISLIISVLIAVCVISALDFSSDQMRIKAEHATAIVAVSDVRAPDADNNVIVSDNLDLVNINTATMEDLKSLPGIGDVLAEAIIAYRTYNGSFERVEQLLEVTGIGEGRLKQIADLICVV